MLEKLMLERIKSGTGLIVYGVEPRKNLVSSPLRWLKEKMPDVSRITFGQVLSKANDSDTLRDIIALAEKVRTYSCQRKPVIVTVRVSLANLESAEAEIFKHNSTIDWTCAVDCLVSLSRLDLLVIPDAESPLDYLYHNEIVQTPIELKLSEAMDEQNLEYKKQVRIGKFTADFMVSEGVKTIIVEADGAAFHNAERDQHRDKIILEEHGLNTHRFTGSEIFLNSQACACKIKKYLQSVSNRRPHYNYEKQCMDSSQLEAVKHGSSHARILAPAGSGKTLVLINRISHLLNNGVNPSSVLAIAFNNKAAQQLSKRLEELNIDVANRIAEKTNMLVSTFNALGYQILLESGFPKNDILKGNKLKKLVQDALTENNIDIPYVRGHDNLGLIIKEFARVSQGLMNPASEQLELADKGGPFPVDFLPIYSAIRDKQGKSRQITFDDQIFQALRLLLNTVVLRHQNQRRFQHILVDEYQDLNKAQISLLRVLASGGARLFAVGDDDQLIYSFREAKTKHLLKDFELFFPYTKSYALKTNYRCSKQIVTSSQNLISNNKNRFPKKIAPAAEAEEGHITLHGCDNIKEQTQILVDFLLDQSKAGCNWNEIAVLVRTNIQLIEVANALDQADIPRSPLRKVPLFSTPIGQDLFSYLTIIKDPQKASGQNYAQIINKPNRYITNIFKEELARSPDPIHKLKSYIVAYARKEEYQAKHVKKLLNKINYLNQHVKDSILYDMIRSVVAQFEITSINAQKSSVEIDEADDESILELIAEASRPYQDIGEFLEFYQQRIRIERGDEDEDELNLSSTNIVALDTIHRAKGKEWRICFIFDAHPSSRALAASKTEWSDNEEERRVFYVAMTRARQTLGISTRKTHPLLFIKEAFLTKEIIKKGANQIKIERRQLRNRLSNLRYEESLCQTDINKLCKEKLYVGSDAYKREQRNLALQYKGELQMLSQKISTWRNKPPDGFLKRLTVGGHSPRAIKKQIGEYKVERAEIMSSMKVLCSDLNQWDRVVLRKIRTIGVEIERKKEDLKELLAEIREKNSQITSCANSLTLFNLFPN